MLDLSSYPVNGRNQYIAELLSRLRILKERNCRPHWIVLEEAQQFLPPSGSLITDTLLPMLVTGGWAFVSYRPDRLANPVLQSLDHIVLTRLSEQEAIQALQRLTDVLKLSPEAIPRGYIWLCGNQVVRLRSSARRVPHIRHLHKRFYFHDKNGFLGLEAASLFEFLQAIPTLPIASLEYHQARDDFARWAEDALGDRVLSTYLRKLSHRQRSGEPAWRDRCQDAAGSPGQPGERRSRPERHLGAGG